MKEKIKKIIKNLSVIIISFLVVYLVIQTISYITYAGNLNPSALPSGTMRTLSEIYNIMAGNFDSSSITASSTGNAFQIVKCMISKINTGTCP